MRVKHYPMENTPPKGPARIVLLFSIGALALTIAVVSATGVEAVPLPTVMQTTTDSPSPTPSTSCMVAIPPGYPTPEPLCTTVTPAPEPSPSASPSESPTNNPKKKKPGEDAPKVTLAYQNRNDVFTGLVNSTGKCEDLRRVMVYKVQKGKDATVGKDFTDERARFTVPKKGAVGRYYAKAPKSVSIGYATQVDCDALKSEVLVLTKTKRG